LSEGDAGSKIAWPYLSPEACSRSSLESGGFLGVTKSEHTAKISTSRLFFESFKFARSLTIDKANGISGTHTVTHGHDRRFGIGDDTILNLSISNASLISFPPRLPHSSVHSVCPAMPPVNVLKFPTSSPSDTAPLQLLQNAGHDPSQILGVIGKTEGMQCFCSSSPVLLPSVPASSRAYAPFTRTPLG
jgi:hypothetical protein